MWYLHNDVLQDNANDLCSLLQAMCMGCLSINARWYMHNCTCARVYSNLTLSLVHVVITIYTQLLEFTVTWLVSCNAQGNYLACPRLSWTQSCEIQQERCSQKLQRQYFTRMQQWVGSRMHQSLHRTRFCTTQQKTLTWGLLWMEFHHWYLWSEWWQ